MTEDEMVGWHHRLNGHAFEQTPGDDEGQDVWCATVHGSLRHQHNSSEPRVYCRHHRKNSRVLLQRILRPDSPTMTRGQ